jgi:hypothetical protein
MKVLLFQLIRSLEFELDAWVEDVARKSVPFEDVDEPCALRAIKDLRKGVPELVGILAELEGVEAVVEPSETDARESHEVISTLAWPG